MEDAKTKKKTEREQLKLVRTYDHRSHYITGAIPQWTDDDLRLHMYNEVIEGAGGPYYVASTQIIIPKNAVPRLMDSLRKALKTEGPTQSPKVSTMPIDLAVAVDKDLYEKERKAQKKVQKIRRK
jgi:hypothetical protein